MHSPPLQKYIYFELWVYFNMFCMIWDRVTQTYPSMEMILSI